MALSKYRVWIGRRNGNEDYVTFKSAAELAKWLLGEWPAEYWGLEKYDNDSWVDAFYSDDIVDVVTEMLGIELAEKEEELKILKRDKRYSDRFVAFIKKALDDYE